MVDDGSVGREPVLQPLAEVWDREGRRVDDPVLASVLQRLDDVDRVVRTQQDSLLAVLDAMASLGSSIEARVDDVGADVAVGSQRAADAAAAVAAATAPLADVTRAIDATRAGVERLEAEVGGLPEALAGALGPVAASLRATEERADASLVQTRSTDTAVASLIGAFARLRDEQRAAAATLHDAVAAGHQEDASRALVIAEGTTALLGEQQAAIEGVAGDLARVVDRVHALDPGAGLTALAEAVAATRAEAANVAADAAQTVERSLATTPPWAVELGATFGAAASVRPAWVDEVLGAVSAGVEVASARPAWVDELRARVNEVAAAPARPAWVDEVVGCVAAGIEATARPPWVDELAARLEEATLSRPAWVDELAARLEEATSARPLWVDDLARRADAATAPPPWLDEVVARLDALPPPTSLAPLVARIDGLAELVERLAAVVSTGAPAQAALVQRVADLAARLDQDLVALAGRIEALAVRPPDAADALAAAVSTLEARLAMPAPEPDGVRASLVAVEDALAEVADGLRRLHERPEPTAAALADLRARLGWADGLVEDVAEALHGLQEDTAALRAASAAAPVVATVEGVEEALTALAHEVGSLRRRITESRERPAPPLDEPLADEPPASGYEPSEETHDTSADDGHGASERASDSDLVAAAAEPPARPRRRRRAQR